MLGGDGRKKNIHFLIAHRSNKHVDRFLGILPNVVAKFKRREIRETSFATSSRTSAESGSNSSISTSCLRSQQMAGAREHPTRNFSRSETTLHGWACRTRTRKCRFELGF